MTDGSPIFYLFFLKLKMGRKQSKSTQTHLARTSFHPKEQNTRQTFTNHLFHTVKMQKIMIIKNLKFKKTSQIETS